MGMYTQIFIQTRLVENLPEDVLNILKFLFDDGARPELLPKHEFFECSRFQLIGKGSSYYHIPESVSKLWYDKISNQYYVVSLSDIKNYENEIEKFFSWIDPYIDEPNGQFYGYSRYENDPLPKLYLKL